MSARIAVFASVCLTLTPAAAQDDADTDEAADEAPAFSADELPDFAALFESLAGDWEGIASENENSDRGARAMTVSRHAGGGGAYLASDVVLDEGEEVRAVHVVVQPIGERLVRAVRLEDGEASVVVRILRSVETTDGGWTAEYLEQGRVGSDVAEVRYVETLDGDAYERVSQTRASGEGDYTFRRRITLTRTDQDD